MLIGIEQLKRYLGDLYGADAGDYVVSDLMTSKLWIFLIFLLQYLIKNFKINFIFYYERNCWSIKDP